MVAASLLLIGCPPDYDHHLDITLYAGDSASVSVVVKDQENGNDVIEKQIYCYDPEFDQGAWLSYDDVMKVINKLDEYSEVITYCKDKYDCEVP